MPIYKKNLLIIRQKLVFDCATIGRPQNPLFKFAENKTNSRKILPF